MRESLADSSALRMRDIMTEEDIMEGKLDGGAMREMRDCDACRDAAVLMEKQ